MLTLLNSGLSDNTVQLLAEGIRENSSLLYLDIRQNSIENDGVRALFNSLMGKEQFITLRINSIHFEASLIELMRKLFSHENCFIQNLEMEELEMTEDNSSNVIDAVKCLRKLYTFDYSNNTLPLVMIPSIVEMTNKYGELEILCLDHCEMTDAACN